MLAHALYDIIPYDYYVFLQQKVKGGGCDWEYYRQTYMIHYNFASLSNVSVWNRVSIPGNLKTGFIRIK